MISLCEKKENKINKSSGEEVHGEALVSFLGASPFTLSFSSTSSYSQILKDISKKLKIKDKEVKKSLSLTVNDSMIQSEKEWKSFLSLSFPSSPINSLCSTFLNFSLSNSSLCFFNVGLKSLALGGKGGFGAELRAKARQRGKKITKDFGSCRDLYGRRLRDVNNQIIMEKWAEAKRTGKEFNIEQETSSGIDLWFLAVPSWSEGLKSDKKKSFIKGKSKTTMCNDWIKARELKTPPPGAPIHWGCPRGARCEFAHGDADLRGDLKEQMSREKDEEVRRKTQKERDDFFDPIMQSEINIEDELGSILNEGMENKPAQKVEKKESFEERIKAREKKNEQKKKNFFELLSGQVLIERLQESSSSSDIFILTASSKFPTFSINLNKLVSLYQEKSKPVDEDIQGGIFVGKYYYEIELLSDGLMQLGWISSKFNGGNDEEGEGVGDDKSSWAYDGFRQKIWHEGEGQSYGVVDEDENKIEKEHTKTENEEESQFSWSQGDIIGCFFSAFILPNSQRKITFSYSKNGVNLGKAFEFTIQDNGELLREKEEDSKKRNFSHTNSSWFENNISFFPSISMEEKESVALHFENFKYEPSTTSESSGFSSFLKFDQMNLKDFYFLTPQPQETSPISSPVEPPTISLSYPLELSEYPDQESLIALGLDILKQDLTSRGLKAGGTLQERAQRIDQIRHLHPDEYPVNLRTKEKKK